MIKFLQQKFVQSHSFNALTESVSKSTNVAMAKMTVMMEVMKANAISVNIIFDIRLFCFQIKLNGISFASLVVPFGKMIS